MADNIQMALYLANKVNGRGVLCPRIGVYLIMEVRNGTCYGKPALMAAARWKPSIIDEYKEEFTVEIQLESFRGIHDSDKEGWYGREIVITSAEYQKENKQFTLEWELLPIKTLSLKALNNLFASGDEAVANDLLKPMKGTDYDPNPIDYSLDDAIEY